MVKKKDDAAESPAVELEPGVPFQFQTGLAVASERPEMTDPGWHSWVMSHFLEDELDPQLCPKVAGLRRVGRLLLGKVIASEGRVEKAPVFDVNAKDIDCWQPAVASYRLTILDKDMVHVTYSAVASASYCNVQDDNIARYLMETAETRAEARAWRKALCLKSIAAEEKSESPGPQEVIYIEEQQIRWLDSNCKRANVNVIKFINSGSRTYRVLDDVPADEAAVKIGRLTDMLKNIHKIPQQLLGYDINWRKTFLKSGK
jgi:hypothetical protein